MTGVGQHATKTNTRNSMHRRGINPMHVEVVQSATPRGMWGWGKKKRELVVMTRGFPLHPHPYFQLYRPCMHALQLDCNHVHVLRLMHDFWRISKVMAKHDKVHPNRLHQVTTKRKAYTQNRREKVMMRTNSSTRS